MFKIDSKTDLRGFESMTCENQLKFPIMKIELQDQFDI